MAISRERSIALAARLRDIVPGGAHTYAKGDDQYPACLAPVIARGSGSHVWDADDNEYIEYGSGLRAVSLGHGHPTVVAAVQGCLARGTNFSRPSTVEIEAAEAFLGAVGHEMVKFAKNGSDATSAAVRLARAATGRDVVAICQDQPFFSTDDWFIGSTAMPAGIPRVVRDLTVGFKYNDLGSVREMFATAPGPVACVILEPAGAVEPADGFLQGLQALCAAEGALLVFDEMITGFRWALAGAQRVYGVQPDLATFGKAMGNGFAVAALVGRRELMKLGGYDHDRERVFLLSTTHGAETTGLTAMLAVLGVYRDESVIERLDERGARVRRAVLDVICSRGLERHICLLGRPCNLVFATLDNEGARSQAFRTLLLQELIARGVLAPSFVVSAALTDQDIDRTVEAVDGALQVYQRALADGVERHLVGRPVKPVFRAYA